MTLFEKRRGAERLRRTDPNRASSLLAGIDALEAAYHSRVIPIDGFQYLKSVSLRRVHCPSARPTQKEIQPSTFGLLLLVSLSHRSL